MAAAEQLSGAIAFLHESADIGKHQKLNDGEQQHAHRDVVAKESDHGCTDSSGGEIEINLTIGKSMLRR
jgi:hypothetical protein